MSIGTPTLVASKKEANAGATQTSTVTIGTTIPAGSTVFLCMLASITSHQPAYVTNPGGERWHPVGVWDNGSAIRVYTTVMMAYTPNGISSGETLTVRHASSANATRLFAVFYVTGRAIIDSTTPQSAGNATSWSLSATSAAIGNGYGIVVVGSGNNITSTDSSTPSATELYDDNQANATTGDRALLVAYTPITIGNTFTPSGTFSGTAAHVRSAFLIREAPSIGTLTAEQTADSPSSLWSLDETVGSTAVDGPGTADGTYVSSPTLNQSPVPGSAGRSVRHVAASTDDTTLPTSIASSAAFSLSMCIKMHANLVTACLRDNSSAGGTIFLLDSAPILSARLAGSTLPFGLPKESLLDGKWHHIGVTRPSGAGAGTGKLYFDGILFGTGGAAGALTTPFHIAKNGTNANFEDISADEFAYYTSELSATRMAIHAEAALEALTISNPNPMMVVS